MGTIQGTDSRATQLKFMCPRIRITHLITTTAASQLHFWSIRMLDCLVAASRLHNNRAPLYCAGGGGVVTTTMWSESFICFLNLYSYCISYNDKHYKIIISEKETQKKYMEICKSYNVICVNLIHILPIFP